jgi:hypothetical protein
MRHDLALKGATKYAVAMMLAGAVLGGCKKEEPTATPPPPNTAATTKPSSSSTMIDQANRSAADAKTAIENKAADAKAAIDKAAADAKAVDASAQASKAADAAVDAAKTASSKLDQVKELISEKKLDDADKALKSLEGMKDKLPANVQDQLSKVRSLLDQARLANGATQDLKIPSLPGK